MKLASGTTRQNLNIITDQRLHLIVDENSDHAALVALHSRQFLLSALMASIYEISHPVTLYHLGTSMITEFLNSINIHSAFLLHVPYT